MPPSVHTEDPAFIHDRGIHETNDMAQKWKTILKGKCALGPFLSILVIECQHKCLSVKVYQVMDKVQIKSNGMFLDLVHCFMD